MADDANQEYFKSQGWPTKLDGSIKSLAELDKSDFLAIARMYGIMLQTEFRQIVIPPKPQFDIAEQVATLGADSLLPPEPARAKRGHGPRGKRELPGARAKRKRKSK